MIDEAPTPPPTFPTSHWVGLSETGQLWAISSARRSPANSHNSAQLPFIHLAWTSQFPHPLAIVESSTIDHFGTPQFSTLHLPHHRHTHNNVLLSTTHNHFRRSSSSSWCRLRCRYLRSLKISWLENPRREGHTAHTRCPGREQKSWARGRGQENHQGRDTWRRQGFQGSRQRRLNGS